MSDTLTSAKAILEADTGMGNLVALATGGIWDWDETGRMGINRSNAATAAAWSNGIIKPCLLLKVRTSVPFGEVADDAAQVTGARDMLEVWAYQDNGYSTIKSMLARVYVLLQGKRVGGYVCRWALDVEPPRDVEMDANVQRSDYEVFWLRV
jgi:hypothetical protein